MGTFEQKWERWVQHESNENKTSTPTLARENCELICELESKKPYWPAKDSTAPVAELFRLQALSARAAVIHARSELEEITAAGGLLASHKKNKKRGQCDEAKFRCTMLEKFSDALKKMEEYDKEQKDSETKKEKGVPENTAPPKQSTNSVTLQEPSIPPPYVSVPPVTGLYPVLKFDGEIQLQGNIVGLDSDGEEEKREVCGTAAQKELAPKDGSDRDNIQKRHSAGADGTTASLTKKNLELGRHKYLKQDLMHYDTRLGELAQQAEIAKRKKHRIAEALKKETPNTPQYHELKRDLQKAKDKINQIREQVDWTMTRLQQLEDELRSDSAAALPDESDSDQEYSERSLMTKTRRASYKSTSKPHSSGKKGLKRHREKLVVSDSEKEEEDGTHVTIEGIMHQEPHIPHPKRDRKPPKRYPEQEKTNEMLNEVSGPTSDGPSTMMPLVAAPAGGGENWVPFSLIDIRGLAESLPSPTGGAAIFLRKFLAATTGCVLALGDVRGIWAASGVTASQMRELEIAADTAHLPGDTPFRHCSNALITKFREMFPTNWTSAHAAVYTPEIDETGASFMSRAQQEWEDMTGQSGQAETNQSCAGLFFRQAVLNGLSLQLKNKLEDDPRTMTCPFPEFSMTVIHGIDRERQQNKKNAASLATAQQQLCQLQLKDLQSKSKIETKGKQESGPPVESGIYVVSPPPTPTAPGIYYQAPVPIQQPAPPPYRGPQRGPGFTRRSRGRGGPGGQNRRTFGCWNCGRPDHWAKDCPMGFSQSTPAGLYPPHAPSTPWPSTQRGPQEMGPQNPQFCPRPQALIGYTPHQALHAVLAPVYPPQPPNSQ